MTRNPLIGKIDDPILRTILEHLYLTAQSKEDVIETVGGATFTLNESTGSNGQKTVKLQQAVSFPNNDNPLIPGGG